MVSGFIGLWYGNAATVTLSSLASSFREYARSDVGRVGFLALMALVPRVVVALRLGSVCDDGYFYLTSADAYFRGDLNGALWYLNVNVYPVLLAGFQWCGLDTLTAAKCWGVGIATATVWPLYCWLRALFDRNIAFAAGCVYAFHPEFIELSAEPIRDATFWFLTAASLYSLWRAAVDQRMWQFGLAGVSIAFAAHTRSEGWLLAIPAAIWFAMNGRNYASRRRVLLGASLTAMVTPLFLVAFNLTVLANHDRWEWGRKEYVRMADRFVELSPIRLRPVDRQAAVGVETPETLEDHRTRTVVPNGDPTHEIERPMIRTAGTATLLKSALRTLEPIPILLMIAGVLAARRVERRIEMWGLYALFIAVAVAVVFRSFAFGDINGRYFLMMFFAGAGSIGQGACWLASSSLQALQTRMPAHFANAVALGIAMVIGGTHVGEAIASDHPSRLSEVQLGVVLGRRIEGWGTVAAVPHALRVGYSSQGKLPAPMLGTSTIDDLEEEIGVVVVETQYTPEVTQSRIEHSAFKNGWESLPLPDLPRSQNFRIYVSPKRSLLQASGAETFSQSRH